MNHFIVSIIISFFVVAQVQFWINPKKKIYLLYQICIVALLTYSYLSVTSNIQKIIVALISFVITIPLIIKSYKEQFYHKVYSLVIQAMVSSICIYFSEFIYFKYGASSGLGRMVFSISVILTNLSWCTIMYLLRRYVLTLMPFSEKTYVRSLIYSVFSYIPVLIFTLGFDRVVFPLMVENLPIVIFLIVVYVVFTILDIFVSTKRILIREQNLKAIDVQSRLYQQYMVDLHAFRDQMRIMQHDNKHLIDNILALLENSEIDVAISQLRDIKENSISNKEKYFCKNPSINAILIETSKNAEKNKIKFETTIRLDEEIHINGIDLSTVMLNALNNALESCAELPENIPREIKCYIYTAGGYFVLKTENYILEKPVIIDGVIQTNKEIDKNLRGIGLESIRHTAKLYDGMSNIEADDNIFKLKVIMENKVLKV